MLLSFTANFFESPSACLSGTEMRFQFTKEKSGFPGVEDPTGLLALVREIENCFAARLEL